TGVTCRTAKADIQYEITIDKKHNFADYLYVLTAISHSNMESLTVSFEQKTIKNKPADQLSI
ncbi:MAG: hypothetical protein Q8859_07790, partial [Bacteroidota bacterium]|nr:hypothetical protein [Bacteroidota bacterium]